MTVCTLIRNSLLGVNSLDPNNWDTVPGTGDDIFTGDFVLTDDAALDAISTGFNALGSFTISAGGTLDLTASPGTQCGDVTNAGTMIFAHSLIFSGTFTSTGGNIDRVGGGTFNFSNTTVRITQNNMVIVGSDNTINENNSTLSINNSIIVLNDDTGIVDGVGNTVTTNYGTIIRPTGCLFFCDDPTFGGGNDEQWDNADNWWTDDPNPFGDGATLNPNAIQVSTLSSGNNAPWVDGTDNTYLTYDLLLSLDTHSTQAPDIESYVGTGATGVCMLPNGVYASLAWSSVAFNGGTWNCSINGSTPNSTSIYAGIYSNYVTNCNFFGGTFLASSSIGGYNGINGGSFFCNLSCNTSETISGGTFLALVGLGGGQIMGGDFQAGISFNATCYPKTITLTANQVKNGVEFGPTLSPQTGILEVNTFEIERVRRL